MWPIFNRTAMYASAGARARDVPSTAQSNRGHQRRMAGMQAFDINIVGNELQHVFVFCKRSVSASLAPLPRRAPCKMQLGDRSGVAADDTDCSPVTLR